MTQEISTIVSDCAPYLPKLFKSLLIWFCAWNLSLLAYFIFDNMRPSRLFYFWAEFLAKKYKVESPFQPNQPFFYKILGGCPFCANVWLCIIMYPFIYYFCALNPFELVPALIVTCCISNYYLINHLK